MVSAWQARLMEHRGMYDAVDSVYFAQRQLERAIEALRSTKDIYIPPDATFDKCGWRFVHGDKQLANCDISELIIVAKALFRKVQELQAEVDKKQAQSAQTELGSVALELLR